MNTEVMFSSKSAEHATPQDLYDALNTEFGFTLDPCATHENAKCDVYFTEAEDGLKQDWVRAANGGAVWMNPPYGRGIVNWIVKAVQTSCAGTRVVCLLPARTDTKWWHEFIWDTKANCPYRGVQVRFLRGRLKFGNATNSAPFPSVVVIFSWPPASMFTPQ